jgi:hypothetical protein
MDFARQYDAPSLTFEVSELVVRAFARFAMTNCRYTWAARSATASRPTRPFG